MRALLFCLVLFSILGCKPNPFKDFELPNSQECNEIIDVIIKQDTFILRNEHCITFIDELVPMKIRTIPFIKGEMPPICLDDFHSSLDYFKALGMFDSTNIEKDSLYFVYQNDRIKTLKLNLSNRERFAFSSLEPNCVNCTIQFSIPILNFIKNKAFVRVKIGTELKITYVLYKIGHNWKLANSHVEHIIRCG